MVAESRTKEYLLHEVASLRGQVTELKASLAAQAKKAGQTGGTSLARQLSELLSPILFDITDGSVTSHETQYDVVKVNEAEERAFGKDVTGKKCDRVYQGHDDICRDCPIKKVWTKGHLICSSQQAGAQSSSFEIWAFPVVEVSEKTVAVLEKRRDLNEPIQAEEARLRENRLESVGALAGGIAHDFNNMLTGILGNIQLAEGYLKQNKADEAQKMLAEAEKASLRAKALTQQLLSFSRGGAPVKKAMSLDQLIRETAIFALRGSKSRPEFAIPDDLWSVEANGGQLNQVISNIVINADQAMPRGGIINVTANNVAIDATQVLSLGGGNYVEIAIKDHGTGIPQSYHDRIFDQYFTTKEKGHGLGLATCLSIIKKHDGHITFESELGAGTTFHVYLPAAAEKAKEETEPTLVEQPVPLAQGKILVMDDDEAIRSLLSALLEGAGYSVDLASDGAEAIRKYVRAKKSKRPFDAVIMDLTIPGGMGGKEAIRELLKIDPQVKTLVSSGYASDPLMRDFGKYGFKGTVTKPYKIGEMLKTLQKVLGAPGLNAVQ